MNTLGRPYQLSPEQIVFYQKNRFITLKNVFDAATLSLYNEHITRQIDKQNTVIAKLEERDTYGIGPLSSDETVTAWIPLQEVPAEMGPIEFSAGSYRIVDGRELKIGDDSEKRIAEKLRVTDFEHVIEPFKLGEVSFHSGSVFHRGGPT